MTARDLTLEGLERAVNALIGLDPDVGDQLVALHGKVIGIVLKDTPITLYVVPGHDGRLQFLSQIEGDPDAKLEGSVFDLWRASDAQQGVDQLFAGRVTITGDTAVAQRFSKALARLDIDWEEQLAQVIGDIPAHEFGRAAQALRNETQRLGESGRETLADFLTEESRLLPHRFEVEAFLDDVDTTRDDVERLAARITQLEKRHQGSNSGRNE